MPPEQPQPRTGDRTTVHYTMKTSSRQSSTPSQGGVTITHTGPGSQPFFSHKSTTPTASSPRLAHSAGQAYPPKMSPSTAHHRLNTPHHVGDGTNARTPSPNYFGLIVEPTHDPQDSAMLPRENWSPATSSVRSFAAAIPKQLPLDANPEFEAFKRQADANRGRSGFSLSTSHFGLDLPGATSPAPVRPRPPRWHTHGSDMSLDMPAMIRPAGAVMAAPQLAQPSQQPTPSAMARGGVLVGRQQSMGRMDVDTDAVSLHDSAYVSGDSKRNSEASLNAPPPFFNMPRRESPGQFESPFDNRTSLSTVEDRHPRLSVTQGRPDPPTPASRHGRAETMPGSSADSPSLISAAELKELLQGPDASSILLLDIRSHQKYSASCIQGALNLCIPTTLLKRTSFNLQKLQSTFQSDADQDKFAEWRETSHLIVYHDTEKKDDVACINMLKKFTSEKYTGKACILRGGFEAFSRLCPQLLDRRSPFERNGGAAANPDEGSAEGAVAKVIGGFMLPTGSDAPPSAFFSNIRQNTELANGVGQIDVAIPPGLDLAALPPWLRMAVDEKDHGKTVSDRFLRIEKREQARMHKAYTSAATQQQLPLAKNSDSDSPAPVQLSGIEKGSKNRYNNILPFDHTRVRLEEKRVGECDYINASHITTNRSYKRYISTQGPLPATFGDFWSMIWEQDVRVIVMLTAEHEGGQLKCHPYWRGKEFGPIKLRALSEKKVSLDIDKHRTATTVPNSPNTKQAGKANKTNPSTPGPQSTQSPISWAAEGRRRSHTSVDPFRPDLPPVTSDGSDQAKDSPQAGGNDVSFVIVRKFALSHSAHPFAPIREITHLHYPSWPDFGAPAQPSHLLALVELANVMQRAALPVDVNSAIAASSDKKEKLSPQNSGNGRDFVHEVWNDDPVSGSQARPMLVHCSAGCGRTGTFCTVDTVVDLLKRQRQRAAKRAAAEAAMATATAARRERATRRREMGVKRKLEQRDSEGDVSMSGGAAGTAQGGRATYHPHRGSIATTEDGSVSPTSSFQGSIDATSSGFHFSSPPPRFPSLASISASREARASSSAASISGSDEGGGGGATTPSYSSSSSSDELRQRSPTADSDDLSTSGLDLSWLDETEGNEPLDLVSVTVEDFRGQRLSMVQTLRQFVLCYETVLEWAVRLQERTAREGSSADTGVQMLAAAARSDHQSPLSRVFSGLSQPPSQ